VSAARRASGAAAAVGRAERSPRSVTRGESTKAQHEGKPLPVAKIDWLNCTFPVPAMSLKTMLLMLSSFMGDRPVVCMEKGGLFGFETRNVLYCYVGAATAEIGSLASGGMTQNGRMLFQLSGKGCGMVTDWLGLSSWLEDLQVTYTRVDLAVDFLNGENTVDDCVRMHKEGLFTSSGRSPNTSCAGDWLDRVRGRTLYIGKAVNGKSLRCYEKGKQLGDLQSPWVRYEVQLGNRDRVIPLDVLTDPSKYFAGAYPALAALVEAAPETISTTQTEGHATLGFLLYHLKRCYGKVINFAAENAAATDTDLIEEFRIMEIPRRLNPSSVVAGLKWTEVKSQIWRMKNAL